MEIAASKLGEVPHQARWPGSVMGNLEGGAGRVGIRRDQRIAGGSEPGPGGAAVRKILVEGPLVEPGGREARQFGVVEAPVTKVVGDQDRAGESFRQVRICHAPVLIRVRDREVGMIDLAEAEEMLSIVGGRRHQHVAGVSPLDGMVPHQDHATAM